MARVSSSPDEESLRLDEAATQRLQRERAGLMDRYLQLAASSTAEAEAYVYGMLKPRLPPQVALRGRHSGALLGQAEAMNVITNDILGRGDRRRTWRSCFQQYGT